MIQLEIYDLNMKTDIRARCAVEILMSHRQYRMKQQLSFGKDFYEVISKMGPVWILIAN
jgi:hypothetical protein